MLAMAMLVTSMGWVVGQPPTEDKRAERQVGESNQGVPLNRLPVPENGMIVVTPDLKKALDALGAGSVVLSAEHYQELVNRAERMKSDKPAQDILFAKCLIQGEVKTSGGREFADLSFELEFRTETAKAVVPIPFKGIRLSSASLNGGPPIWGGDPEKWSLLIEEPKAYRLKLTASVPITRVGQEKRLTLERVPASAITSLELLVPGTVPGAMVLGYGSVTTQAVPGGKTQLSAPALGVLSNLDLTWQASESASAGTPAAVEGDIRIGIDEGQAQIEGRFKPVPFTPIQLPWKVRLPKTSQSVRAELMRTEASGVESLVVTRQSDGLYQLSSPFALNTSGFSQVVIRWRQPLPEPESAEGVFLGGCEIVEPAGRVQSGTIQLNLPEDVPALFKPKQLISIERGFPFTERENRRSPRYRYQQQPAGFEAVSLPRSQTKGVIEARVNHALTALEGSWMLSTEIEVLRSTRSNLSQLELAWPAEWPVSRKLLFSPMVKEIEQDTKAEKLRVILDGRQAGSLTLKMESMLPGNPSSVSVKLPQLLTAWGMQQERLTTIEAIVQQERLKLEANGWDLQVVPTLSGLREENSETLPRRETTQYQVIGRPAQLTVSRQARLPKWSSSVEVFVGREQLQTKQLMEIRTLGISLRRVSVLVPRTVRSVAFAKVLADGRAGELLVGTAASGEDGQPWRRWQVEVPISAEKMSSFLCLCEQDSAHPITVPLVRIDEAEATLEGVVRVRCVREAGFELTLPGDLTGWKVEKAEPGGLDIQGASLQSLLVLERHEGGKDEGASRIRQSLIKLEDDGASCVTEIETTFADLRKTELALDVKVARADVSLIGWKLDDQLMPENGVRWQEEEGSMRLWMRLPADRLRGTVKMSVGLRIKQQGKGLWHHSPAMTWMTGGQEESLAPQMWLVRSDPSNWLWWSNTRVDDWHHLGHGWLPTMPHPMEGGNRASWFMLQSSRAGDGLQWVAIPRSISLVILSGVSLLVLRILSERPRWAKRMGWVTGFALLGILVIEPELAAVLFWGSLPGVAVGAAILGIAHLRSQEWRPRNRVFQSTGGAASTFINPAARPPRSVVQTEAPTIISTTSGA